MSTKTSPEKNELKVKDHISYSQTKTGRCKLRYKHLALLRDIKEETVPMKLGRLVHKIIAEYSRECIEQKLEADYQLIDSIIDTEFSESGIDEEYFQQVRQNCVTFGEQGFNYNTLLLYEKRFKFSIGTDKNGNSMDVTGIVDRVNVYETPDGASADIIDYKNQRNILTEEAVQKHEQLNLYAFWFFMHEYYNGFYIGRTGIYHVPYNYTRWSGKPQHISDWTDTFSNVEKWLERQWNRLILDTNYDPTRGPWCFEYSGCPVMKEGKCPLWSEEEVERMKDSKMVLDKVRALRVADYSRKIQVSDVKGLFEGGDNIDVDDQEVGFVPKISYQYDLLGFMKWLEKYDVVPEGITINKTDAEGLVKRLKRGKADGQNGEAVTEEDETELEKLRIETASSRFVF